MPTNFTFELDSFEIDNTLSKHEDTDYLVFTVRVGNTYSNFFHKSLGNVNNGVHQVGLAAQNIPVNTTDSVLVNYLIVNAGSATAADVDQAMQLTAGKLAAGDLPGLPRLSSLTIQFADWFKQQLGAILQAPCDGAVAAEQNTFTYDDLVSKTSQPPFFIQRTSHSSPIPGPNCNTNPSLYVVNWSMKQFHPPTPPAAPSGLHVISKQAAAGPGASSITIGWTDNSDNEGGFNITYDGSLPGSPDDKGERTVSSNSTTATITGLTSGYTYVIEVQSFNTAGNGGITYISGVGIPYVGPPAPRVITISKQGTGSATSAIVSGSGFTPNSLIVIRIVAANLLSPVQFSTTAGGDGKFSASKSFSCVSGIVITFTAFEDANPTGTISNAVSMTC